MDATDQSDTSLAAINDADRDEKDSTPPIDVGEELLNLVRLGLEAGWDNRSQEGFLSEAPKELLQAPHLLTLRGYQLHAVNRILNIMDRGEKGALLAYGMGLGKTIIVIKKHTSITNL
jgi:SNF2 family DNA or RNA helicase